jgi:hypothetical protein
MSSIIGRLTEGIVNRDMQAEGSALLSKWEKTGLLEGLRDGRQRSSMARLLENQAKELLRENSSMAAGDVEGFAAVAFPIVRRVFAGLISNELVSVQPMSLPSGLIFFLDFLFSPDLGGPGDKDTQSQRFGNTANKSIYGTDQVGSQITGGVDLVQSSSADFGGPRISGRGYAYGSATGSATSALANYVVKAEFDIDDNPATESNLKLIDFDPDLLALSGSGTSYKVIVLEVDKSTTYGTAQADFNNLSAFKITNVDTCLSGAVAGALTPNWSGSVRQVRRLTQLVSAADSSSGNEGIRYYLVAKSSSVGAVTEQNPITVQVPMTDDFDAASTMGAVVGTTEWGLEGSTQIPEIDIKVDSVAVTAMTKKLKAKWTPELGQDLNAYHNLDAEVELTSILSEQIALEIDREILADLVGGATAATYFWSRSPGLFVNRETGAEIGASSAAPDFTGTVSEWYETLAETINDVSAAIHRKTLRGGANFVVCGPEVANILEFTAGFRASVTHDDERGSIGSVKVGSLSKKFDVIVDPYFQKNLILIGRRGSSFLESGYVYAPYVPLQTTPTIFGPEDFVPRKGVMTRYAKKMVRPDMYGLVIVRGLIGESGATT